ncbi:hypothetical protein DJ74_08150 [Halorubrum sp. Ea8]|jgi:hypothetical protein|nr:hypothetical protein DJ74_08150 [Halorubrum sp. Ea8]
MSCRIRCNDCDLDRWFEDCVTAHKRAKNHEARYTSHWVTLYDPPEDSTFADNKQRPSSS